MNPVFYIGSGCGEIHLKMDNGHSVNIKIATAGSSQRYLSRTPAYNGIAEKVTVNGVDQPNFVNRRITYTLLNELYKIATGEYIKYGSIFSGRNNIPKVKELIQLMAPDLHIDFKLMKEISKPKAEYSVDDQIFNFWMKNNV